MWKSLISKVEKFPFGHLRLKSCANTLEMILMQAV